MTYRDTTLTKHDRWRRVRAVLEGASGIAWDGCHKIYVLLDEQQMEQMRDIGYDPLLPVTDPDQALETLKEWFEDSCGLRFISSIKTVKGDANKGFTDLIAQFEDEGDDD